jgi:CheY-like chemotaxis protein
MWSESKPRPFEILLVEDNPADVRLIREALNHGGAPKILRVAEDGVEALEMLAAAGPVPDLIVLDLSLPRMNGHELLAHIRAGPRTRLIPVVIFSSSASEEDISMAYGQFANCYVSKPGDLDRFFEVLHRIESFWFDTAQLPAPLAGRNT